MMTIKKTVDGSTLVLALEGRLDTTTAPQLENELKVSLYDSQTAPRAISSGMPGCPEQPPVCCPALLWRLPAR